MSNDGAVSCGERLVQILEAYGIDTVFGIPGNHTVQLYRGLGNSRIRHISPRHEQGAAFMADGYARASGKPAACFLISGPGLGNAITPMIQALADSIPMLVVTAVAARAELGMGEGRLHEVPDQSAMARQCSRFSHTLMRPDELPKVLARAFAVFDSARPGPVHIQIPMDVIVQDAAHVSPRPWPRVCPPAANAGGLEELADKLRQARKPVLLLGGGAVAAAPQMQVLAETLAAPVVNTVNAKGILPPGHPLLVGGSPSLSAVRALVAESDLVLAIGTEFGETDYDMLFLGDMPEPAWLARIDIDPAQLCRNQRSDLALCGDARESVASLLGILDGYRGDSGGASRVAQTRIAIREERHWNQDIQALFDLLHSTLPGLCLVGDSTLPTYYAVWQYEASSARRYFHSATGGGTLGYALPAAMGARRALPSDVPVLALIGDGAAQFTFMELASAVQEQLPIIVLLWNNNGYREIREGMLASGIKPVGVDIDAPDFVAAATALGCHAQQVDSLASLAAALSVANGRDRPTLLELPEDSFLSGPVDGWY
ncbi:5-guanidino-2-oxopentanoate decarboxylase [Congregibacter variabilis]|uniref:5-guanidino-2-oxopentanoate decarboxylase n=1 Tax=Congregibacter variabilis TaxID=3081200 RepID=A0ABZ0I5L9_9GAMM|nr:5-guanidino-2-oxopentanoate decarboxylase [Congregibacter sp. IMCC43200]